MKKYQVIGSPMYLNSGDLELTPEQAAVRARCLVPTETPGRYSIASQVCFKTGEIIGYDGNQAKKLKSRLKPFKGKKTP